MTQNQPRRQRVLFLFSDTGGGHRSAAEAVKEALSAGYDDQFNIEMVDFFKEYAPPPLNRMPKLYPEMVKVPKAWGLGYRLSNGHERGRLITNTLWPYIRVAARRLVNRNPSDVIVSFHPMANAPVLRALGSSHPPFITVVTDLVSTHALWYHRRADLVLVPTAEAEKRAVQFGLRMEQVKVVGLPVAQKFCKFTSTKEEIRRHMGLPLNLPLVLLVGGGEGMGPLLETALAISRLKQKLALVIVAGRNQGLKKQLESVRWTMPVFIYGFVREMPDFMNAADILVTKAGPGTISEAFNAGLPMILYSRLPGQEEGNVGYVLSKGAGVWAPSPDLIASALSNWLLNPEKYQRASAASRSLASPMAAHIVADILAAQAGVRLQA